MINNIDTVLHVNQDIKNYKTFMQLLNEPILTSSSKNAQLKRISEFIKFHKENTHYIIDNIIKNDPIIYQSDVLTDESEIVEKYGNDVIKKNYNIRNKLTTAERNRLLINANRYHDIEYAGRYKYKIIKEYTPDSPKMQTEFDSNLVMTYDQLFMNGVYAIQLDNKIYIGSTTKKFLKRYKEHKDIHNTVPKTREMILGGAIFYPLWISKKNTTTKQLIERETEYIRQYENDQNYELINTRKYAWELKKNDKSFNSQNTRTLRVLKRDIETIEKLLKDNNIKYEVRTRNLK